MYKFNPLTAIDFYKSDHRRQYPEGTEYVYSNFTPRSGSHANVNKEDWDEKVVFFGLQAFIKSFLMDAWDKEFFSKPKKDVIATYKKRMDTSLGADAIPVDHIEALHDLGHLPLKIKALPEGTRVPLRVPMFTIVNTDPRFFWLTNYLESVLSTEIWGPCTSATTAYEYRKLLDMWAETTGADKDFVGFQGHDFSFRGLSGIGAAMASGGGHLLSFNGTDTVPAIDFLEQYYNADCTQELIGASVAACYDDQTEVLTIKGWEKFKDLKKGTKVAQYTRVDNQGHISFVEPTDYYDMEYKGEMIKWGKDGYNYVDLLVTPNHKMVRINKDTNELSLFEAGDCSYRNRSGYSHRNYMPIAGYSPRSVTDQKPQKLSPIDRLKIVFQADGSYPSREEEYKSGQVRFSLKKERKKERLVNILEESGLDYSKSDYDNGYSSFWVKTNLNMQKDFSWVSLEQNQEWYDDFVNELQYWDGTQKNNCIIYSSINKNCVDKVQAICAISGYKTQFSEYQDKRDDSDRKNIFSLIIQDKDKISGNRFTREKVDYEGRVYCVSVPSKMLVVRRNNIVAICGNTEHSVMCAGGKVDELGTFHRLITDLYPAGIVSIVSDTWDFWKVITQFTVELKDEILAREGKVVFRPDSGDPVKIICGDPSAPEGSPAHKGAVQCLWEVFGGTETPKGYKVLNEKVGLIYGDSITLDRAKRIMTNLARKGFASSNVVFGIGSFTYQYVTRDTYGFAMKATYTVVNGEGREIFKDPVTDSGMKKSAKGLLRVEEVKGELTLLDQQSLEGEQNGCLQTVFEDGRLLIDHSLAEIRERLRS